MTHGRAVSLAPGDARIACAAALAGGVALQVVDARAPCPLLALTGVPCPFCGMTTSVEATVALRLTEAVAANPAGVALIAAALWLTLRPRRRALAVPASVVVAAVVTSWLYQLVRAGVVG